MAGKARNRTKDGLNTANFGTRWPGSPADSKWDKHPAEVPVLLDALARVGAEAVVLAERAYEAIQHHSFDPYREFCDKRAEHSALVSVLRAQIGPKPREMSWPAAVNKQERALIMMSVQACMKFVFALSANPLMPLGARETFIHELAMLQTARDQLTPHREEEGVAGVLDELEMALMILEEIVEKAPAFEEF
jgi:hypothetical protein